MTNTIDKSAIARKESTMSNAEITGDRLAAIKPEGCSFCGLRCCAKYA